MIDGDEIGCVWSGGSRAAGYVAVARSGRHRVERMLGWRNLEIQTPGEEPVRRTQKA
jgi:hypothetical protein